MSILLTGGSGFLMRNLRELYPNHDYIYPTSSEVNWVTNEGVQTLPQVDVVIHSAATYGGLQFNQNHSDQMLLDNTRMNVNLFDYILRTKPGKVITIGSGCSYPGRATGLLKEKQIGCGRMHSSVEVYGISKLWALSASKRLLNNWDHLVLANMYGKYDHTEVEKSHLVGALLSKFIIAKQQNSDVQLIGTGIAQRDLIYVNDVCKVINESINNKGVNKAVNVSTGVGTTVKELADLISELLEFKGSILWGEEKDNGALFKVMDTTRMKKYFSSVKTTQLKQGLEATIPWFVDHHKLLQSSH